MNSNTVYSKHSRDTIKDGSSKKASECKRCKATSTVWTMGPDECFLGNPCGQQYEILKDIFNVYKGDIRYLVYIDPLPFVTSTFMTGTSLSIVELKLIINAFSSIIKDQDNIFSFENSGLVFITDGNIFTVKKMEMNL
ncbi:hypothetical protein DICPUDRAFT_77788 [Dictyostelium purpureum]|uniref:GATA-type domain-containing protein n=1 Tax=Dictyostelium purpureum TaxID=5786 RepID=F0ZHM2_DICPU|nr:uncharacterized protein DICPUDRAFT_77788 [Dictyostelium purpureum]EGC36554.1 hypothetical protein DICPUDRAFT_77788 [Dictyostelium purpureum]|eukprot:XP_003286926.1 hypothetical protein DICPUDRAFT_77788 [Dictyostelium purpureum]